MPKTRVQTGAVIGCCIALVSASWAAAGPIPDIRLWKETQGTAPRIPIQRIRDVVYYDDHEANAYRHQLDVFVPEGRKNLPVVVLVHGGAWVTGDNRCCGLYSSVGEFLAHNGMAAVLPNYRLSPGVKHPEHVKDVARALAWTRKHIAECGGNPNRIILVGHSAGGHIVSLLTTDEKYLKAEGLRAADIKGVISVSGVYRIPPGSLSGTLGGKGPMALNLDCVLPMRGSSRWSVPPIGPGIPLKLDIFGPAFGNDPNKRRDASPVCHVRRGLPPFLILHAQKDLPTLSTMAREFYEALRAQGCEAEIMQVRDRNHNSIMFNAIAANDPVAEAMLDFIKRQYGTAKSE
jgi:acetyl esterase/lipase